MFGLIPVIIAPADRVDFLNKNYLPHIIDPSSSVNENSDKNKFFSDVFISKKTSKDLTTELLFDNIAYKYDYTRKNQDKLKSTIKYGDQPKNLMHNWYVGLDLIFVDRADFNYEEGYVKLYSAFAHDITKVKLMLLLYFAIFSVFICIILGCWLRCCCQTTSSKDYKKGDYYRTGVKKIVLDPYTYSDITGGKHVALTHAQLEDIVQNNLLPNILA